MANIPKILTFLYSSTRCTSGVLSFLLRKNRRQAPRPATSMTIPAPPQRTTPPANTLKALDSHSPPGHRHCSAPQGTVRHILLLRCRPPDKHARSDWPPPHSGLLYPTPGNKAATGKALCLNQHSQVLPLPGHRRGI